MDPAEVRDIVQFNLEARLGIQILNARSEAEAIGLLLTDTALDLIIVDTSTGEGQFAKFAEEKASQVPCIEVKGAQGILGKKLKIIEEIPKAKIHERLPVVLGTWVLSVTQDGKKSRIATESDLDREFCRIQTHLLLEASPLKSDIYLRLSARKYLRLFFKGDSFDRVDLEKYLRQKKVEYLYLKSEETSEFVQKLNQKLERMLEDANLRPAEAADAATMAVETVREIALNIGFTPEVQKIFKSGVALVIKSVSKNPGLAGLIQKMLTDRTRYISAHSVATAQLACAMAQSMDWRSETTFQKLTMASMLHDVTLRNENLCQIKTLKELEVNKDHFTSEEITAYQTHPVQISQMVKSFQDIHADVDLIISQHHESPLGGGFPKGLPGGRISPLACLFIVAHDLADALVEKGMSFDLNEFMESRKELYNSGNFKKALAALPKAELNFGGTSPKEKEEPKVTPAKAKSSKGRRSTAKSGSGSGGEGGAPQA